jgi:type IV pilus assembly protein PilW
VLTVTAARSMVTECIASGIEDLQLEYGIDTSGDGAVNRYIPNPTLAELQRVASVRISLLARTTVPDRGHTEQRTYRISNAPDHAPADNFHRRVYSTTVPVHNLRHLQRLGIGS